MKVTVAGVEFGEVGLGGQPLVEHELGGPGARDFLPVVGEGEHLTLLRGLGHISVGVDEVVGVVVLGEHGQHTWGSLRAFGDIMPVQGGFLPPVLDRVEVQIEVCALDHAVVDHRLGQGGEKALLAGVVKPVGVGAQRGGLGDGGRSCEPSCAGVGGDARRRGRCGVAR